MMSTLCGLRRRPKYKSLAQETKAPLRRRSKTLTRPKPSTTDVANPSHRSVITPTTDGFPVSQDEDEERETFSGVSNLRKRNSANFDWARSDQLSVILEILEKTSNVGTPQWEKTEAALKWDTITKLSPPPPPTPRFKGKGKEKRTRWLDYEYGLRTPESGYPPYYSPLEMSTTSGRRDSPVTPRAIEPPPTDVSLCACWNFQC